MYPGSTEGSNDKCIWFIVYFHRNVASGAPFYCLHSFRAEIERESVKRQKEINKTVSQTSSSSSQSACTVMKIHRGRGVEELLNQNQQDMVQRPYSVPKEVKNSNNGQNDDKMKKQANKRKTGKRATSRYNTNKSHK